MSVEAELRAIVRDEVRAIVREELRSVIGGRSNSEAAGAAEFMSVAEAAKLIGISAGTIRTWIKDGRLVALHAGRKIRLRRTDVVGALDRGQPGRARSTEAQVLQILSGGRG